MMSKAEKEKNKAIEELRAEIRSLNSQIKGFARSKEKITVLNLDGTEAEVDPIPGLENKKHVCMQKYEQLNEGKSIRFTDEEKMEDFLVLFFQEIERKEIDREWLAKFYHPQATMTWIEGIIQTRFENRDLIVDSYVRRYQDLSISHAIRTVVADKSLVHPEAVLGGTITVNIRIEKDTPRQIKYMIEWVKAVESGLFDISIIKEFFWTIDARPLYHWPEKLLPHEIRALQEAEERRKRAEFEALQEQLRLAAEEKKRRKEAGELADDDEDEEDDEGDDEGEEDEAVEGDQPAPDATGAAESKDGDA